MSVKHDKACRTNGGFITFRNTGKHAELNVYRGEKRVSKIVLEYQELERMMGLVAIQMGELGYFGQGVRQHEERPRMSDIRVA